MSGLNVTSRPAQNLVNIDQNAPIQGHNHDNEALNVQPGNQQGKISFLSNIKNKIVDFFKGLGQLFGLIKAGDQALKSLAKMERTMDKAAVAYTQNPRDYETCVRSFLKAQALQNKLLPGDRHPISERFIESLLRQPGGENLVKSLGTDKGEFVNQMVSKYESELRKLALLQESLSDMGLVGPDENLTEEEIQTKCDNLKATLEEVSGKAKEKYLTELSAKFPQGVSFDENGNIHGSSEARNVPQECRFLDPEHHGKELSQAVMETFQKSISEGAGPLTGQAGRDIGRQQYSIPSSDFDTNKDLQGVDGMDARTEVVKNQLLVLTDNDETSCRVLSSVLSQSHLRFFHDTFAKEDGSVSNLYLPSKCAGKVDLGDGQIEDLGLLKTYGGAKFVLSKVPGKDGEGEKFRVDVSWDLGVKAPGSAGNYEELPMVEDGVLKMHVECSFEVDVESAKQGKLQLTYTQYPKATFSGKLDI